jgi:YHS domain-containing protein
MNLEEKSAKMVTYDGRLYLVASDACKARFEADPGKYIDGADRPQHERRAHRHGCC